MKVLFINQFFYPDVAPSGQLIMELADYLVKKGFQVSVLCSRSRYSSGWEGMRREVSYSGIRVYRIPATNFGRAHNLGRLLDYLSFFLAATLRSLFLPRHEIVITRWTPPFIPLLGLLLKWVRGSRYISWVHDLYPDVAIALGVLREGSLSARLFEYLCRRALKGADRVITIGGLMAENIRLKGVKPERITLVADWEDGDELYPLSKADNWFLAHHNLTGKFNILYSGNMGLGHEFATILQTASLLRDRDDLLFLFIGDGPRRREIEGFKKQEGLTNILILPYQKREVRLFSLNAGDLHLVSLREGLEGLIIPYKIYSGMACRKPIIYIGPRDSEAAHTIRKAHCGCVVDIGDVDRLAATILELYYDEVKKDKLGSKGRAYFEKHFERKVAMEKLYALLREVLSE